jgi:hypothetical protein
MADTLLVGYLTGVNFYFIFYSILYNFKLSTFSAQGGSQPEADQPLAGALIYG